MKDLSIGNRDGDVVSVTTHALYKDEVWLAVARGGHSSSSRWHRPELVAALRALADAVEKDGRA